MEEHYIKGNIDLLTIIESRYHLERHLINPDGIDIGTV